MYIEVNKHVFSIEDVASCMWSFLVFNIFVILLKLWGFRVRCTRDQKKSMVLSTLVNSEVIILIM